MLSLPRAPRSRVSQSREEAMTRIVRILTPAVIALGLLGLTGAPAVAQTTGAQTTGAQAAGARTAGAERFSGFLLSSGISGDRQVLATRVWASGIFTGVGHIVERPNLPKDSDDVSRDNLVFPAGTLRILNRNLGFSDRKGTRLSFSHMSVPYDAFCLDEERLAARVVPGTR